MRNFIFIYLMLVFSLLASGLQEKVLILNKTVSEIELDGIIEQVWSEADSVNDFIQFQPYNGLKPTQKTVAKILTTDRSIYCLIKCYENPENIESNKGKLDDFTGDMVSVMFDTFGDNRTAYKFAVSASGVRSDSRMLDDGRNRDYSWDGIWFAHSKIYQWGYVVEMEIPYKSIQYDKTIDSWGLDFDRWIPQSNEDIYWCSYEENEGQRISKFGQLSFENFKPQVEGLNLEIYPVGYSKAIYSGDENYDVDYNMGIDIFYNPSPKLTFQLTANPDFAQIEADPFDFNISRYESYFSERRPFFTKGNEIFAPSGRQRSTNFYSPLELFYSRRIGEKLPDGQEVPILMGTKAFGRVDDWEYGGFFALTGETDYTDDGEKKKELGARFGAVRVNKKILENSSIGILAVAKNNSEHSNGVIDIDGAFRESDWQLAYQVARSINNGKGDYALSAGFTMLSKNLINFIRTRYIGAQFDISDVGFVPWQGTTELTGIIGPRWYFEQGILRQILLYGGLYLYHEKDDHYIDHSAVLGLNMNFRNNWGYEINLDVGEAKDLDIKYTSYGISISSWFQTDPSWHGNVWGSYNRTYNFSREYLAFSASLGSSFEWKTMDILELGTSFNIYVEGNPDNNIEEIYYNARPYFSLTPVNDLNFRLYIDNLYLRSSQKLEQIIVGFLFSYNYSPKSWLYFAINEIRDRNDEFDRFGKLMPNRLHVTDRVAVIKLSYLYYF